MVRGKNMYPELEVTDEEELMFQQLEQQYYEEMLREYEYMEPLLVGGTKHVAGGVVHY
jgi:hypothetical protein